MIGLIFSQVNTIPVVHFRVFDYFFDFLPLNLLFVRSHQAEIIIATTCPMMVGVEPRSCDHDHTVAVKSAL